jgi:hypothetical protein
MKKYVFVVFFSLLLFLGCDKKENTAVIKESSGVINEVSVIIDNHLWNGVVGDSIRNKLAAEVEGLAQPEPLFNLNQHTENIFKGYMKSARNIVIAKLGDSDYFLVKQNVYAKPQNVIYVVAKTPEKIIDYFEKHSDSIIKIIQDTELVEKQKRIKKSVLSEGKLIKKFNLSMKIPSSYKYVMEGDKFIWVKKEITSGNCNLLIYDVPIHKIEKDTNVICNITTLRDSIGRQYIGGTIPDTYLVTEDAFTPYFYKKYINAQFCYLTKGTWELKNDFMTGPFVNYAIRDIKNNRMLIIEGFVYAPSKEKRDYIQELEAVILTATIKKSAQIP